MNTAENQYGTAILIALCLLVISSSALLLGSQLLSFVGLSGNWPKLAIMLWTPVCLLSLAVSMRRFRDGPIRSWSVQNIRIKVAIGAFFLGICSAPILALITNEIRVAFFDEELNHQIALVMLSNPTLLESCIAAFSIIIFVPIAEEVLYRGLLFDYLRTLVSDRSVVLVSAITFGIAHFDVANSIGTGILGIGLGALRLKSNTIWPCILLHSGFNLVGYSVILLSNA